MMSLRRVVGWVATGCLWAVTLFAVGWFVFGMVAPDAYCEAWVKIGAGRQWAPPSPVCIDVSGGPEPYAPWGWGDSLLVLVLLCGSIAEAGRRLRRGSVRGE